MKKHFPLFLIILLSISLSFCVQEKEEKEKYEPVDNTLPQQQLDDVFTVEMNGKDTIRTIKALHMDNYPKKKLIIADTVYVTEFNDDKTIKSKLYCDKAEINQITDIYKCRGNVIVTTPNGILKTPFLIWDKKNDKIIAKNGVTLTRENNVLQGETLETNSKLTQIKITKVSAKGKLEQKDIRW